MAAGGVDARDERTRSQVDFSSWSLYEISTAPQRATIKDEEYLPFQFLLEGDEPRGAFLVPWVRGLDEHGWCGILLLTCQIVRS